MANFKKLFNLIIISIFLCQSAAFCQPASDSLLRPILKSSKTLQDWPYRSPEEIISDLDATDGYFWTHLKDDERSRETMHRRLNFLLREKNLPDLVKNKLGQLKKAGRLPQLTEADIENCSIFIFGDALWHADNDTPHDIDMLIIVKGSIKFPGEIWDLDDELPHVAVNIKGEKDLNSSPMARKNYMLLKLSTGVTIYGKNPARFNFSPTDLIEWCSSLIEDGFSNDEFSMGDLGDSRKEWKRFLESYLYLYPYFASYMPEVIDEVSDRFLQGEDIESFIIKFFNGAMDRLPWFASSDSAAYNLYDFGAYLQTRTSDLKSALEELDLLSSRLMIEGEQGIVKLETLRFPDGEFNLRILNPSLVKDSAITVTSSLDSPDDLVKIVLLTEMLRLYKAKKIRIAIDKPCEIANGLDKLLCNFCDELGYLDADGTFNLMDSSPLELLKRKEPLEIHEILYQHVRLENDARIAAETVNATISRLMIDKKTNNPLDWQVSVPQRLKGKNIVLVHSTENSADIAELWVMLIALRKAGVNSLSLINTYEGYSRQHKIYKEGQGISAITMLKSTDMLLDHHLAINLHYAVKSGLINIKGYEIFNLNSFVQIAEDGFDRIVEWIGIEDLVKKFSKNPILLVGPDDGALVYVKEAAAQLESYIEENYSIKIKVHFGYMPKKRLGDKDVDIPDTILREDGKPLETPNPKDCWVIVIDDETSWGTTLLKAEYVLVRKTGIPWHHIIEGATHAKLAQGLGPFKTGWEEREITDAIKRGDAIEPKPEYIDDKRKFMPPRLFICTRSVSLPSDFPDENAASIGPVVGFAIKRILGFGRDRLKAELLEAVRLYGAHADQI